MAPPAGAGGKFFRGALEHGPCEIHAADSGGWAAATGDGTSQNEATVRAATDYTWKFSETGTLTQSFIVESGSDNTFMESASAVKARLVGNIALVASYTVKRNSSVPAGNEKTDTFTALSLEYAF